MKKQKEKDIFFIMAIILAVVIVIVAAGMLLLFIFSGKKSANSQSRNANNVKLEVVVPDENNLDVLSSITISNKAKASEKKVSDENSSEEEEDMRKIQTDANGYATYTSASNHFSCKYPAWFTTDANTDTLFACSAPDDSAYMGISFVDSGNSVEKEMTNFINSVNGSVDYKSSGDTFFAVRMKDSESYYYQFSKFDKGHIYSFNMVFPLSQFETYDNMINDIYSDFIKQF